MPAKPLYDMTTTHTAHLASLAPVVPGAIVSKPLIDTGSLKQVLFSLDAGQEISEHRVPWPATVHVLDGELSFRVDGVDHRLCAGDWLLMPLSAAHSLRAVAPSCMLLTLIKGQS